VEAASSPDRESRPGGLRRELKFWEAIALSIAIMAPTAAMALNGGDADDQHPGTIGVLSLLVAYIVTNVGAIRYLFIRARRAPLYEIVVPLVGIAFLIYTLYKNVQGVAFPYSRFPLVVGIWLAIGLAIVVATPRLASRIGESLAREECLVEPAPG
jgi:hypothetical protein